MLEYLSELHYFFKELCAFLKIVLLCNWAFSFCHSACVLRIILCVPLKGRRHVSELPVSHPSSSVQSSRVNEAGMQMAIVQWRLGQVP